MSMIVSGWAGKGSSEQGTTNQTSQTNFRPEDMQAVQNALKGYQGQVSSGQQNIDQSINQLRGLSSNLKGASLNTEFAGPQFSTGLDTTSRNLVSTELGNRLAQQQRQQQNISQMFGGRNQGLASVLKAQNASQAQLANNPLAFQAFQQQFGREAQTYGLGQQAQGMTNQARLAQQEQANQAMQGNNQFALNQNQAIFGQNQSGIQNAQSLLQALAGLAQMQGQTITSGTTSSKGRSGGVFS